MQKVLLASLSFSAYEWLPYPVGTLISYCLRNPVIRSQYQFLEPEYRSYALDCPDFLQALDEADILGLTNWVWNQNYNDRVASLYKSRKPQGLVIYGGTNVPENPLLIQSYRAMRPFVDLFFCGPAEKTFHDFLLHWREKGIEGHPGTFTQGGHTPLNQKFPYREIALTSPYLDGIFDPLIAKARDPLSAIFETNRGCPYSCSFCDWGGMTRSKVVRADEDMVRGTIDFIMSKPQIERIEIADANFGLFEADLRYMQHLVAGKRLRETPIHLSMGGFAKNGGPYVEPIMELMYQHFDAHHGRKYVKFGFQSHSQEVLKVAQRENIKNERLTPLIQRFRQKGIEVDAEMIIGLPGETQKTWLESIQRNMELGVNHQKSFSLFVVANTALSDPEYREKYGIKTKKLLIPHDLYQKRTAEYHQGRDRGPIVTTCDFTNPTEFQENEHIYQCYSYDSHELMRIFDVWFWFNTLYNAKIARTWMLASPLKAWQQYEQFMGAIEAGEMPLFKRLLEDFRYGVWNTIAKPEPVTQVKDLYLVNFAVKFAFRGNEVVEIVRNQAQALEELRQVYPDLNFSHFRQELDLRDMIKLYFVGAEVT